MNTFSFASLSERVDRVRRITRNVFFVFAPFFLFFVLAVCQGMFPKIFAVEIFAAENDAAKQWKTVAIVSVTSSETGLLALKNAAESAGHAELVEQFDAKAKELFPDYDFTRPRGIIVQCNGTSLMSFLFAPFTDLNTLPFGLGGEVADSPKNRAGWSEYMFPNGTKLYLKQEGGWAYATLDRPPRNYVLPENPVALLEGLEKEHLLAVKLNCENLPGAFVDGSAMLVKQIFPMLQMFLQTRLSSQTQSGGENIFFAEYFKCLATVMDGSVDIVARNVKDCKTVLCSVDTNDANDLVFECEVVAKPGTELAGTLGESAQTQSETLGFYRPDDAIFAISNVVCYTPTYKKAFLRIVGAYLDFVERLIGYEVIRDDEDVAEVLTLFNDNSEAIRAVLTKWIESGKGDVSYSVLSEGVTLGGIAVPDAKALRPFWDDAVKMLAKRPGSQIEFSTEQYGGYDILRVSADPHPTVIALGERQIIFAGGSAPNLEELVKTAIDRPQEPQVRTGRFFVFTPARIAEFPERFGIGDDENQAHALQVLGDTPSDANVVGTLEFAKDTAKAKIVMSGKLWLVIGKLATTHREIPAP